MGCAVGPKGTEHRNAHCSRVLPSSVPACTQAGSFAAQRASGCCMGLQGAVERQGTAMHSAAMPRLHSYCPHEPGGCLCYGSADFTAAGVVLRAASCWEPLAPAFCLSRSQVSGCAASLAPHPSRLMQGHFLCTTTGRQQSCPEVCAACPWHVLCAESLSGLDMPANVCMVCITQQGQQPLTADHWFLWGLSLM